MPMSSVQETLGGLGGSAMYGVAGALVAAGAAAGYGAAGAAKAPLPAKVFAQPRERAGAHAATLPNKRSRREP